MHLASVFTKITIYLLIRPVEFVSANMGSDSETTPHLSPERFNETLEPLASPSKRPKTLTQSPTSSKGKDKVCNESTVAESESHCCGICLVESERIIRGRIDSCNHYFCFICIMEWAKVESRCPFCKRRFSTIRRPPIDGLFLTERVVNVPVRNQVYHFYGIATVAHRDPYSLVKCTVCSSDADETLLLLCDLCDSAAHTYCVGMGDTVPEGDWFCQDCSITRAEHSKSETDAEADSNSNLISFGVTDASLHDIVRETNLVSPRDTVRQTYLVSPRDTVRETNVVSPRDTVRETNLVSPRDIVRETNVVSPRDTVRETNLVSPLDTVRETNLVSPLDIVRETNLIAAESLTSRTEDASNPSWLFSPSEVDRRVAQSSRLVMQNPRTHPIVAATASDLGARTVSRCRNVQSRIRELRENWNRFRSGSLSFSSSSVDSSANTNQVPINSDRSGQLLSTPPSSQLVPIQNGSSLNTTPNKSSYNEAKAWKMLNAAKKSLEKSRPKTNLIHKRVKTPVAEVRMPVAGDHLNSNLQVARALVMENRSHKSQELEKQRKFEKFSKFDESSSSQAQGQRQLMSSVRLPISIQASVGQNRVGKPSEQNSRESSSDVCTAQDRSVCFISQVGSTTGCSRACPASLEDSSVQAKSSNGCTASNSGVCQIRRAGSGSEASNTSYARLENPSSSKLELAPGKAKKERCQAGSKSSIDVDDDAKCQIQFLVKLNLKAVTRDKKLGVDTFKEIARHSTHSILAACGLKQLKPGARSFPPPSSACRHLNQVVKPRMSTLMPSLCIECFHAFVKYVVDTTVSEKIGSIQRSSQ